jgi:anaerobic magnesium-protoporphyrin IX monomethyl ester cyclase
MKICLIRAPSPFLIEDAMVPPLGLMAVGTGLKRAGHDVTIHDGRLPVPTGFDCYGIGPTIPEYEFALSVRKNMPDARIVIGGPYATLTATKCIKDGFDCVVIGDGEDVEEAFTSEVMYLKAPEGNLDNYPIVDRSLVNIRDFKYPIDDREATTIVTGRGCPFKCGFCCKNHKTVRLRHANNIIEEIDYLYYDYGYNALAFPEDLFILDKKRAEVVFRHMKLRDIASRCLVRADVVARYGPEFCEMMVDCGCTHVGMGVESGSDTILTNVNKGETAKTIKYAIKILQEQGVRVKGFFIIGLPGESKKTLDETRAFLDEVNLYDVDIKIFQPYSGSPIADNKDDYDIDWDDTGYGAQFYKGRPGEYFGNVRTSSLTSEEIVKEWIDMEATYKHA